MIAQKLKDRLCRCFFNSNLFTSRWESFTRFLFKFSLGSWAEFKALKTVMFTYGILMRMLLSFPNFIFFHPLIFSPFCWVKFPSNYLIIFPAAMPFLKTENESVAFFSRNSFPDIRILIVQLFRSMLSYSFMQSVQKGFSC